MFQRSDSDDVGFESWPTASENQTDKESFYCSAIQHSEDIICAGSDEEETLAEVAVKRCRYEEAAKRYACGQIPVLQSAQLKGPFDYGWTNPWRYQPRPKPDWWQPGSQDMLFTRKNVLKMAMDLDRGDLNPAEALAWCKRLADKEARGSYRYCTHSNGHSAPRKEHGLDKNNEACSPVLDGLQMQRVDLEARLDEENLRDVEENEDNHHSVTILDYSVANNKSYEAGRCTSTGNLPHFSKRITKSQWLRGSNNIRRAHWRSAAVSTPTPVPDGNNPKRPCKKSAYKTPSCLDLAQQQSNELSQDVNRKRYADPAPSTLIIAPQAPGIPGSSAGRSTSRDSASPVAEGGMTEMLSKRPKVRRASATALSVSQKLSPLPVTIVPDKGPDHCGSSPLAEEVVFVTEVVPSCRDLEKFQYRKRRRLNSDESNDLGAAPGSKASSVLQQTPPDHRLETSSLVIPEDISSPRPVWDKAQDSYASNLGRSPSSASSVSHKSNIGAITPSPIGSVVKSIQKLGHSLPHSHYNNVNRALVEGVEDSAFGSIIQEAGQKSQASEGSYVSLADIQEKHLSPRLTDERLEQVSSHPLPLGSDGSAPIPNFAQQKAKSRTLKVAPGTGRSSKYTPTPVNSGTCSVTLSTIEAMPQSGHGRLPVVVNSSQRRSSHAGLVLRDPQVGPQVSQNSAQMQLAATPYSSSIVLPYSGDTGPTGKETEYPAGLCHTKSSPTLKSSALIYNIATGDSSTQSYNSATIDAQKEDSQARDQVVNSATKIDGRLSLSSDDQLQFNETQHNQRSKSNAGSASDNSHSPFERNLDPQLPIEAEHDEVVQVLDNPSGTSLQGKVTIKSVAVADNSRESSSRLDTPEITEETSQGFRAQSPWHTEVAPPLASRDRYQLEHKPISHNSDMASDYCECDLIERSSFSLTPEIRPFSDFRNRTPSPVGKEGIDTDCGVLDTQIVLDATVNNPWTSCNKTPVSVNSRKRVSFGLLEHSKANSPAKRVIFSPSPPPISPNEQNGTGVVSDDLASATKFEKHFAAATRFKSILANTNHASQRSPGVAAMAERFIAADGSPRKQTVSPEIPSRHLLALSNSKTNIKPMKGGRQDASTALSHDADESLHTFVDEMSSFLEDWSIESELKKRNMRNIPTTEYSAGKSLTALGNPWI